MDVWLLPQIQCNNTITFITRKIFSRWLWSVPSNLTSGKCGWDHVNRMLLRRVLFVSLAIHRPSLPWCTEPGSRIRAFKILRSMVPLEVGMHYFISNSGGSEMLPASQICPRVCDRSIWHGGRRRQFFLNLYNRVSSQRDATELAPPYLDLGAIPLKTDETWVWITFHRRRQNDHPSPLPMVWGWGGGSGQRERLCVCSVTHSCLTLCDPMDCSSPGFSVLGISQARITGGGCRFLFHGNFLTQGSNPLLLSSSELTSSPFGA